ncbi:hypothetical protein ACOSQ3_006806 [Xanthoceras sorbifolium]
MFFKKFIPNKMTQMPFAHPPDISSLTLSLTASRCFVFGSALPFHFSPSFATAAASLAGPYLLSSLLNPISSKWISVGRLLSLSLLESICLLKQRLYCLI